MSRLADYGRYASFFIKYNPVLAAGVLLDEIRGEAKYRLDTTGFEKVDREKIKGPAAFDAHSYMPSNYVLLERLFTQVSYFKHNGSFLDIGCGKGRAMMVAAHYGFTDITGIEVIEDYCQIVQNQIKAQAGRFEGIRFNVCCTDAAYYPIPDRLQTIFFYNPFREIVMGMVLKNIMASLERNPRRLFIIYLNPSHIKLFTGAGFKEVYHTSRFGYLEASLLLYEK